MKKLSTLCVTLFFGLSIGDWGQMLADATFGDKYLKPISMSRQIAAGSQKEAVNTAVKAAGKTGWTPKTIASETGYVLAEYVADLKYSIIARDYTFRLEVRLPENGKGDANIIVTPPPGLVSSRTMDQIATVFLDALTNELTTTTNVSVSEKAENKSSEETVQQPSVPRPEMAEAKPSEEKPTQQTASSPSSPPGVKETASQKTLIMTANANARSGPDAKSKLVSRLKKGEKVVRLGISGARTNVKLSSGLTGWVLNKYTKEYK